ncbi:gamma carbonic anhydrase family protein [Desulfobacterales bacterium HSG16]|nr:gamma carbonic anhydrase family protein [Desulfobacterales bacterium HSG16]
MLLAFQGKKPTIGSNVFIAHNATVIGDVTIDDGASIWYGSVLRADEAPIHVGKNSNIQDNCTIHTDEGKPASIDENVTVGHNAVVHGCTVEKNCLIGIGAVVLNDAVIKTGSVVAAGAVVKEGQIVGPCQLVAGAPAVLKKELGPEIGEFLKTPADIYTKLAAKHMAIQIPDQTDG